MKPRAIFFGTPEIAVPSLRALTEIADVVAVVCQPDKPVGRESTPAPPPVKRAALELGIPVHQPVKVRTPDFLQWVIDQDADVGVVLAYGRILTRQVLEAPRKGCINLHASLLPRYRGAAPINWCIVRGEAETGISLMQMDEGIDTGPVFCARTLSIGENEDASSLAARIAQLGAEVIKLDLPRALSGELSTTAQNEAEATLAPIMTKEHGKIDWSQSARAVHDHVRGLQPWPGAFTTCKGKTLKVLETRVAQAVSDTPINAGATIQVGKDELHVACGEGSIVLVRGQLEGKKALSGAELLRGRAITPGEILGGLKIVAGPCSPCSRARAANAQHAGHWFAKRIEMPLVTLPGQTPITLNVRAKSDLEVKQALAKHLERFVARRLQLANNNISFASSTLSVEGIRCKLHVDAKDKHADDKKEQLRIALMSATTAGFSWPSDQLEVFVYQGAAFSVGWLLRQAHVDKAVVLLGDSAVSTGTRLVADTVKDREARRGERLAQQARIRTATFHELGHVQHQKLSPSHYFALSQIPMLVENVLGPGREERVRQENREKVQQLFENTTVETLKSFSARLKELSATVSTYAGSNPCEFVAEVYSGLMMSETFSDDVRAAYLALGGPPIDDEAARFLKGRTRSNAVWTRATIPSKPVDAQPVFDIGEGL